MAATTAPASQTASSPSAATSKPAGNRKTPQRRVYDHKMTDSDKFALQSVLKAKAGLSAAAVAIQEGKTIDPNLVKSCLAVQAACADLIFQG